MAILLRCDKCNKEMRSLEKHIIKDDKYLCVKCGEDTPVSTEVATIPDDWDGVGFLGLMIGKTFHKMKEYTYFHNCNFQFEGTTTYDLFRNQKIMIDPTAHVDSIVDIFKHDNHYILSRPKVWCVYYGFSQAPIITHYDFDKEVIENALSALPNPVPLGANPNVHPGLIGISVPLVP